MDTRNRGSNENLPVTAQGNEPPDRRKSIRELFAGYDDDYTPGETDRGTPVGKEM